MRWRVARPVVESVKVGDDERRQNQAMKLTYSGCSGEDNVVEVASVDEEGARDHVKRSLGIEGVGTEKDKARDGSPASETCDELQLLRRDWNVECVV